MERLVESTVAYRQLTSAVIKALAARNAHRREVWKAASESIGGFKPQFSFGSYDDGPTFYDEVWRARLVELDEHGATLENHGQRERLAWHELTDTDDAATIADAIKVTRERQAQDAAAEEKRTIESAERKQRKLAELVAKYGLPEGAVDE